MKPEIKQKWVEALRSGEYQQCTMALRKPSGFCCLGVLCDLYAKDTGTQWDKKDNSSVFLIKGHGGDVPIEVIKWAGITDMLAVILPITRQARHLTYLNDTLMMSFSEIADVIENQL